MGVRRLDKLTSTDAVKSLPVPTETVAPTIHKVQGMTLDLAAMDISKSFEHGQAYVALTRYHTPEGLQLLGDRKGAREALMRLSSAVQWWTSAIGVWFRRVFRDRLILAWLMTSGNLVVLLAVFVVCFGFSLFLSSCFCLQIVS